MKEDGLSRNVINLSAPLILEANRHYSVALEAIKSIGAVVLIRDQQVRIDSPVR
jgi:hypothetical protein